MMTEETIPQRSTYTLAKDQVSSDLQGEVVILNFQSGMYYGLDPVGARIWHLLQVPRTANEILETLLDEYEVEPARCEQDLHQLLQKLTTEGLIEIRADPGS
jgi:hypothetical protein